MLERKRVPSQQWLSTVQAWYGLFTLSNRTISVEVLQQLRTQAFGTASAYSVLLILMTFLLTLAARWLQRRSEPMVLQ